MASFDDFYIGCRVSAISGNIDRNRLVTRGLQGTVMSRDNVRKRLGVQWDTNVGGHSLSGACHAGYGWWAPASDLCIVEDLSIIDDAVIASDDELFAFLCKI